MQPLIKRIEALESTSNTNNLWAWRYSGARLIQAQNFRRVLRGVVVLMALKPA